VTPHKETKLNKPRIFSKSWFRKWFYGFTDPKTKKVTLRPVATYAIIVGVIVGLYFTGIFGSIGTTSTPSPIIRVNVVNAGDFSNVTTQFSAVSYSVDPSQPVNNATFHFYKSWVIGTNGSAADLHLLIGVDGKAFVIRIIANRSLGYGNCSDISFWATKDALYTVKVLKNPTSIHAALVNITGGSNITGRAVFSTNIEAFPNATMGLLAEWQPQLYNDSVSYFNLNITYDHVITANELKVTSANNSPYGSSNYLMLPYFTNGNRSVTVLFFYIYGGSAYSYSFMTNPSIANITSVAFQYGPLAGGDQVLSKILV
jgi:hypothetical protein